MMRNACLALMIVSILLLVMALGIHMARAHDHQHPERNEYLRSLHSKGGAWCCNVDDHDAFDEWETKGSGYRVKFRGQWFDVPEGAVIDGPNKIGDAMLWMNKGIGGMSVRCFLPGPLT